MAENGLQLVATDRVKAKKNIRSVVDDNAIAGLAQTYREIGQKQPILVDKNLNIIDGHRRHLAALKAGLITISVIVVDNEPSAAEVLHTQLVTNLHNEDVKPMDKARAIESLVQQTGSTAAQVAMKLGISNATVSRLLSLLQLPEEIRKQVETGAIAASAAYELALVTDPAKRAELGALAAEGKLSRDALRGARKKAKRAASPSSAGPARAVVKLGDGKSITINSAGLTLETCVDLIEQLLAKLRDARKREWSLNSFLKVQDDLSKQSSKE